MEKQESADAGFKAPDRSARGGDTGPKPEDRKSVLGGVRATPEYHQAFMDQVIRGRAPATEQRAVLQVDSDAGGGFFAASEIFINKVIQAMDESVVIRQLATVTPCKYNENLGALKLVTDVGDFEWAGGELAEGETDEDIEFGKRELRPWPIKRKTIPISKRLIEADRMDVEAYVTGRVGKKLGKILETAYMTGTSAQQPLGLFVASDDGISTSRDVITGAADDLTADGLMDVQDGLPDAYQANARWLFHRTGITRIRKFKGGDGQYLWQPGLQQGVPNMILAKPYLVSSYVPHTYTNGLYVGMYGDFSWYWIADAISMTVQRMDEYRFANKGQIGLMFDRMAADAMPVLEEAFVRIKVAAS